jgi:cytoskeletal protein CcmA (bactofilin family)
VSGRPAFLLLRCARRIAWRESLAEFIGHRLLVNSTSHQKGTKEAKGIVGAFYKMGGCDAGLQPIFRGGRNFFDGADFRREAPIPERKVVISRMDKMTITPGGSKNVLNSDVEIKGDLKFSGEMTFDGKIEGEIRGDGALLLGESSVVNGSIEAQSAVVRGKINGNVVTKEKLEIKGKTELFGDIRASKLSIEEGVTFVGRAEVNPNKLASTPAPARLAEAQKAPEAVGVSKGR